MGAVQSLGYVPNLAASNLASRRSGIVAVVVPTIGNSVFSDTLQGLAEALQPSGLQIVLGDTGYSARRERDLLRALAGRQPEAFVVVGLVRDAATRALLRGLDVPVVETWDLARDPVDIVVGFSNRDAGAAVARHMLERGRRCLAAVAGADARGSARVAGFASEARRAGVRPPTIDRVGSASIAEGRRALLRVLARAPDTDAIFFSTDVLAVGALLQCQAGGHAVPDRVALAGFGDLEIAREMSPALTTVGVGAAGIGRRAGQMLLARRSGQGDGPRVIDLGFTVVARGST